MPASKTPSKVASKTPKTRDVKQIDWKEHLLKRSMWGGAIKVQDGEMYVLEDVKDPDGDYIVFKQKQVSYSPAWYKTCDEIIVNAIDHHVIYDKKVNEIDITYDDATGEISVRNNGPGIHVKKVQNIKGEMVYTPQLIFAGFLSGSNFDDEKDNERIVGGQNGIGAKITSVFSTKFTVETCDTKSRKHYVQTFENNLQIINPPTIRNITKGEKSYTKITFLPEYERFGIKLKKHGKTLKALLESRAWQAAAYTGIKVKFNEEDIPIKSFEDFAIMLNDDIISLKMTQPNGKFPWEVCIGLTNGREDQISLVNGVCLSSGGTHIKHIQRHLVENLKSKITQQLKGTKIKFNKNLLLNNLFIFMKGSIPNPEFLSQTKDALVSNINKFSGYRFSPSKWNAIWDHVKDSVMNSFLKNQLGNEKKRTSRGRVDVPKCQDATLARNPKRRHECCMILTEGDSASGTAETGLSSKGAPDFNTSLFGLFGMQGVPVNALKESYKMEKKKKKEFPSIGYRVPGNKIINNERISSLMKVLNLDFNKSYDFTPKGEKEWNTLRYGSVAGLTDQDLDGFNIFGLIATFFMTYWPHLVARGFIRRIYTPLIRAYPKNRKKDKVMEFYTEKECQGWVESCREKNIDTSTYTFKYYKGLGSHKEAYKEVTQMFRNIKEKICTYVMDEKAIDNMFVYYGEETSPRKDALQTAVGNETYASKNLPLSYQFANDTKMYQLDNIARKLINSMDGFVDGRRKIFYAMRHAGKKDWKIQAVAGLAVSTANYVHGETSAENSAIRMAQAYKQARHLPLLQPLGNFGSRRKGFKDHAASRYIYTRYNWRLCDKLFRREDDFILPYTMTEGQRFEPDHYAPVIPYSICEDNSMPATGWVMTMWARDVDDVIDNVRKLIKGKIKKCQPLKMATRFFNGRFQKYNNRTWFVGDYTYDEDQEKITITGLPPDKWSYYYLEGKDADKIKKKKDVKKETGIKYKEYVADYEDHTSFDQVHIDIWLKPGTYKDIAENYGNVSFDPLEEYFELKGPIYQRINLIGEDGSVIEYKTYEDVLNDWFDYRKNLYGIRVERERVINDYHIKMLKQMQKFSRVHDSCGITNKISEEKACQILKSNKFPIYNKAIIVNPKFNDVKSLKAMITQATHGASYNYLLSMSYRDLTQGAYDKRAAEITRLEERQLYLEDDDGQFPGAKIWLKELDECEKAIKEGIKSDWFYGDNVYKFDNGAKLKKQNKRR